MNAAVHQLLANWIEQDAPIEKISVVEAPASSAESLARRAYELIWNWSAPRYIGNAGTAQDRFFERCGPRALERRINRAKWFAARLCS